LHAFEPAQGESHAHVGQHESSHEDRNCCQSRNWLSGRFRNSHRRDYGGPQTAKPHQPISRLHEIVAGTFHPTVSKQAVERACAIATAIWISRCIASCVAILSLTASCSIMGACRCAMHAYARRRASTFLLTLCPMIFRVVSDHSKQHTHHGQSNTSVST